MRAEDLFVRDEKHPLYHDPKQRYWWTVRLKSSTLDVEKPLSAKSFGFYKADYYDRWNRFFEIHASDTEDYVLAASHPHIPKVWIDFLLIEANNELHKTLWAFHNNSPARVKSWDSVLSALRSHNSDKLSPAQLEQLESAASAWRSMSKTVKLADVVYSDSDDLNVFLSFLRNLIVAVRAIDKNWFGYAANVKLGRYTTKRHSSSSLAIYRDGKAVGFIQFSKNNSLVSAN